MHGNSLLWAGALSLAVHGLLLFGFVRPHLNGTAPSTSEALQARLMMRAVAPGTGAATTPAQGKTDAPTTATPTVAPVVTAKHPQGLASVAVVPVAPTTVAPGTRQNLAPAPAYHGAEGLDPPPRPLQDIDPVYPEAAGLQEGIVVLRLLISSVGEVDDVSVVRAAPPGLFDESALQAFRKARFSPGYFLGIPVRSQIFIEVGYTPINRGGAVSGQNR